ncbi:uncharacterized protein J4E88_004786 [Alternaria novae-zelandiae]|uniref:uncharacterized protein n=1 Tax=Alternaria novae-zelandiae TaxID=430562 RepID=UPI0020C281EE|nr:uncharacterized protein J4E88_004786 [Alternaria novae-zelandiae]KAI4683610.1 hypothetical protein J4E88_004786 [Alternaria novae-zelandiae]
MVIQNFFLRKVGKKFKYPMLQQHQVPAAPWTQNDVNLARATRQLPGAAPPVIAAPVIAAPVIAAPVIAAPVIAAPVVAAPVIAAPLAAHPAALPVQPYPCSFWPNRPWHADPEDASIGPKITIEAIKDDVFEESPRADWMATKPFFWPIQDEQNWENKRFLGAGASGCAGLWCQSDAQGNISRRMVIKEARPDKIQWRDLCFWRDQLPCEIHMHQLVDNGRVVSDSDDEPAGSDHETLVRHHGYRLMMTQRRYRIFFDYYEGGNLWQALEKHCSRMKNTFYTQGEEPGLDHDWDEEFGCYRDSKAVPGEAGLCVKIPEGLIWRIASSLVQACQILHFGQVSIGRVQNTTPEWKPIKHCDIRLDNIFIKPADEENEMQEHQFVVNDAAESAGVVPLDEKTDVWQIGAVLYSLLSNGFFPPLGQGPYRFVEKIDATVPFALEHGELRTIVDPEDDPWNDMRFFPTFKRYSEDLKRLAFECLAWHSSERPTLLEMGNRIDDFLTTHPNVANDRNMESLEVVRDLEFAIGQPMN